MVEWNLAHLIQLVGYPGLFAIIFAESGLPIGFFLPGASLLFTSGFLASQHFLDVRIVIPLVGIAAILGDNVGYWFGAKIGIKLFDKPDSRLFKKEYLERTQRFYAHYGSRTILLARFFPIVRTFAPILAGVAGMHYRTFFIYNVVGGIAWASGITYAGYALSTMVPQSQQYISGIVLIIIAITTIPLLTEFWRHRKKASALTAPKAVIFDLDDTLADSYEAPQGHMIEKLSRLLDLMPVAVMSAATFPRIEENFLPELTRSKHAARLYIISNNGAEAHVWDGSWSSAYHFPLTTDERVKIVKAIKEAIEETGVVEDRHKESMRILEREAKVVFTPFPPEAPQAEKRKWDHDMSRRKALQSAIKRRVPEYEVLIGGTSTIDVTQKNINKAYGVRWLAKELQIEPKEMLFVGDALYEGGNDAVVIPTGVQTRQVAGPTTTAEVIEELLRAN